MSERSLAETKIARAKTALLLDHPFFGQLAFRLAVTPMPDGSGCDTMATDGDCLYYHAPFVEKLPLRHLIGVIAHEILHCVLGHHTRRGNRDHGEWNIAADYAENAVLLDNGFALPEGALFDRQYDRMPAEQIYAKRQQQARDNPQQPQGQPGPGQGNQGQQKAPGEVWDAPSPFGNAQASEGEMKAAQQAWDIATMQAAQAAKAAGKLPGFVSEMVEGIRNPDVDWQEALRRYFTASVRDDYSWRRPNVRHLGNNWYFPSLHSESIGEIVIAIDTSGSIGQAQLASFAGAVNALLEQVPPNALHVVYCDCQVAHVDQYEPSDYPIKLTRHGGGGTAFSPVWDWIEKNGVTPTCAIYLTDMGCYGGWGAEPSYPVLWVATQKAKAPFGEVVVMKE